MDREKIEHVLPRVIDNFQVFMRELRIQDLQGSSRIQFLHEELLRRAQSVLKPVNVSDVFFQEILVQ
jgi:flagellar FliL protein